MGEANRRGNKDQRIKASIEKKLALQTKMADNIRTPVNEDIFLFCSNIYTAAAQMTMPVENPESKPIVEFEGHTYSFADTALNRGMIAVMKELREQKIPQEVSMAITWRLMHFGDVLRQVEKFSKWIKPVGEDGAFDVAESLIRACAGANMIVSNNSASYDYDDVERLADEIEAAT